MSDSQTSLITKEMADLVARSRLAYVATVNPDGTPNLSPKGSLKVVDEKHLAFANIASPGTVGNIRINDGIEINVLDVLGRRGFRFKGRASHSYDPGLIELVAGFLGPEYPLDGVVRIEVESAVAVWSPVYDCTDQSEESVAAEFRTHYGY